MAQSRVAGHAQQVELAEDTAEDDCAIVGHLTFRFIGIPRQPPSAMGAAFQENPPCASAEEEHGAVVRALLTRRLPSAIVKFLISSKYLILLVGAQGLEPWTR